MAFPNRSGAQARPPSIVLPRFLRAQEKRAYAVPWAYAVRCPDRGAAACREGPLGRLELVTVQFLNGLQPQLDLTYDDVFMVPEPLVA